METFEVGYRARGGCARLTGVGGVERWMSMGAGSSQVVCEAQDFEREVRVLGLAPGKAALTQH